MKSLELHYPMIQFLIKRDSKKGLVMEKRRKSKHIFDYFPEFKETDQLEFNYKFCE